MYKEHPVFENESINKFLWRYMDFTKFVDLLERKSLFFTRADRFEDKFEGSYSKYNKIIGRTVYKDFDDTVYNSMSNQLSEFSKSMVNNTFINCWHMNEYESAAMWKLYSNSCESIALKTTFNKLKNAFNNASEDIYIGVVNYIDYEKDWLPEGNTLYPYVHKRKSFIHENEARAVIQRFPSDGPTTENGLNIPVDVQLLIDNIYISPLSPEWFYDLVRNILIRYGYDKEVVYSKLNESPIY